MGAIGSTVVGTEKVLSMRQEEIGRRTRQSEIGNTIVGTEKVLSMKQIPTSGEVGGSKK